MRTCVLLTARSGSTFMRHLLMDGRTTAEGAPNPNPLHVAPEALHYNEDWHKGHLINDYIMRTPVVSAPEVYSFYVGLEAGPVFFNGLPGPKDEWRFIYILRDPRGKIESTLKWSAIDLNPDKPSPDEIFRAECAFGKRRAASIASMRGDPRFTVVLFEDLVRDPLAAFSKMLEFGGLSVDEKYYRKLVEAWWPKSNSSFSDRGAGSANRWSGWTSEQKTHFKSVLGQELIDYGFEQNGDW